MKYESTILKRLIDTYGVVGNPRYISEIIKEFIVRGKERFPNLFTYQADWLAHIDEFGLTPEYTVSYTGQQIYAPNTLERPVKSAILKGQTLVNLPTFTQSGNLQSNYAQVLTKEGLSLLKPSTKYFLKIFNHTTEDKKYTTHPTLFVLQSTPVLANSSSTYVVSTNSDLSKGSCLLRNETDHELGNSLDVLLIEYQEGMENWDIPYFEGMQSVKMPVLTTSNEDGTKTNILSCNEEVELRGIGDVRDELNVVNGELTQRIKEVVLNGSENWIRSADFSSLTNTVHFQIQSGTVGIEFGSPLISDKFINCGVWEKDIEGINCSTNGNLAISINRDKLSGLEVTDFKKWLSQNNVTVIGKTTESIKTVDLTILDQNGQNVIQLMSFNGGTHFNTTSLEGSLLPTLSVDVVTDLEETLKVCSLEGNTM